MAKDDEIQGLDDKQELKVCFAQPILIAYVMTNLPYVG